MKRLFFVLSFAFIFPSFVCCKKGNKSSFAVAIPIADPVDSIVGTYTGTMRVITSSSVHGSPTATYDTTYPQTVVFTKIGADTFSTGSLYTNPGGYLIYHSSGIYPYETGGLTDTLRIIRSADSIYYYCYTWAIYDGGSSGFSNTKKVFSGKR